MPAKKYTFDQIQAALDLREKGKSYAQIEAVIGMNSRSVQRYCLIYAVDPPRMDGRHSARSAPMSYLRGGKLIKRFTPDEDRRLLAWSLSGVSRCEMARRTGRGLSSVANRLNSLARAEDRKERAVA